MSTVLLWCKLKDTCVCTVRLFHYEITRYLAIWPGRQFNLISILDCALRTWNKSINHFRPCFYRYIRKLRRSSLKFPLSSEIHLLWFGTFEHYSDVKRVSFIKHFDVFPSPLCDFSGSFCCREGVKWQKLNLEATLSIPIRWGHWGELIMRLIQILQWVSSTLKFRAPEASEPNPVLFLLHSGGLFPHFCKGYIGWYLR